ncbi:hypothetical protein DZG01_26830 [Pseudomonas fluorescens]|nr:hypothetical protein DZG01_26830 [Pseudomonas fluorescens]
MARELAPAGLRSRPQHVYRRSAWTGFAAAAQPSGSKLPRHGAWVAWAKIIASKQARSHRGLVLSQLSWSHRPHCGSELARDRASPGAANP